MSKEGFRYGHQAARTKLYISAIQLADVRSVFPDLTDEFVEAHFAVTEPIE